MILYDLIPRDGLFFIIMDLGPKKIKSLHKILLTSVLSRLAQEIVLDSI